MSVLWEITKGVIWGIVIPVAAIVAYKTGYPNIASILAIAAVVIGWIDVVELPRRRTDKQNSK